MYCITLAITVIDSYIKIFPQRCGIMLWKIEGITKDSNANIENLFRTMENIYQGRKGLSPGNFIWSIHQVINERVQECAGTMKWS